MPTKQEVFQNMWAYHLSKLLPKGTVVTIPLKNGIKVKVRSRTADRMIVKEIFLHEIYNKYGIAVSPGDTVIDIGANIGSFTLYAAKRSGTGMVHAFEPFPDNFSMLQQQVEVNHLHNIIAVKKGLSDTDGFHDLYLSGINTGGHSMQFEQAAGKVTIETTTLRDYCNTNGISHIHFMKIDCEGSEFNILKHDLSVLDITDKIIMECHPYGTETVDSMIALLEGHGFTVIREACNHANIEMLYASKRN